MKRNVIEKRPDWKEHAEHFGFELHTFGDEVYWNEGVIYEFTLDQIENDIEEPATEMHSMCLEAVEKIVNDEKLLTDLCIPIDMWDFVRNSWKYEKNKLLYGRFDFVYDGNGPAKLLEYNADTPTSLYEAASYQWMWLEEAKSQSIIPLHYDQFNMIEERMIEAFSKYETQTMYFSSFADQKEDYMTVEYMAACAREAGVTPEYLTIQDISINDDDEFCTPDGKVIPRLFKLYPWEDMFRDDYSIYLNNCSTKFVEPAWKSVLSNKGILPVLWNMFEGHPNLLESYFVNNRDEALTKYQKDLVIKPVFSREGASVSIYKDGKWLDAEDKSYDENNLIMQEYRSIPNFDNNYPVIGAWIIENECVGMGIREDNTIITQDTSRFTPHVIV